MSRLSKSLIGIGAALVLLSFSVNLVIFAVESQIHVLGLEVLAQLKDSDSHKDINKVAIDKDETVADANEWTSREEKSTAPILVVSKPLLAKVSWVGGTEFFRTPSRVPKDHGEYILSTPFREGKFQESTLKAGVVDVPLKLPYLILRFLFIPGFLCLGLGWAKRNSGTPGSETRASTVRDRSSSLDTVLRSAPPLPPPDGLFEHDPSTSEEDRYGRFIRGKAIGKGSMGEVYRCTSCLPGDRSTYALKILLPEWSKADDFRTRFEREADICRKLDHPNLVRAYDHGEKNGRLWLVMDFVDGEELETWLKAPKRSEQTLIKMFRSIFQGLEYAHNVGVVHRDIKPGNILVRKDNEQPVIADFGLAKGKHYATITKTNTTLGTPTYIAPEQITGGKGSPQSDLYSLGCILYEALAGVPPFEEKDVMKLLTMKLMQETPIELPEDTASPKLRAIVKKLLAQSPEERYGSATEVVEALNL